MPSPSWPSHDVRRHCPIPQTRTLCPTGSPLALTVAVDAAVYVGLHDASIARNFAGLDFDLAAPPRGRSQPSWGCQARTGGAAMNESTPRAPRPVARRPVIPVVANDDAPDARNVMIDLPPRADGRPG
jgi:hypothetical protein